MRRTDPKAHTKPFVKALRRLSTVFVPCLFAAIFAGLCVSRCSAQMFQRLNLVTDDAGANPGLIPDAHLVNAWGVSFSSTSPFWVSANGTGLALLYSVDKVTNAPTKVGLEVTIPGDGSVTGQAFNGGSGFNSDRFLFVSEDGTISGWRGALGTTAEVLQLSDPNNVYKGAALDATGGNAYLLSANFHTGAIDVLKGSPGAPDLAGKFTDPGLPSGFAPFDVQILGGKVYVAYAKQGVGKDEQTGAGLGFVSVFDSQGNFLGRVGSMGALNAPWGLAIAPSSFGAFAGDLLVGNFGDGTINAFNLATNSFAGQLPGQNGQPLKIDGLWALTPGNDGSGGSSSDIYFSAGPNEERHGAFGVLNIVQGTAVPEPGTLALLGGMLIAGAAFMTRRRRA